MKRMFAVSISCLLALCGCRPAVNTPPPKPTMVNTKADYTISAVDFIAEFYRDEAAANAKYKDKVIEMRGWVLGTEDDGEGSQRRAKNIWISSACFKEYCQFNLDREEMDKRFMIIEYGALWVMKGRFGSRAPDKFLFGDSVLVTTHVGDDLPVEVEATAAEVAKAVNDDSPLVRSKFQGRKIAVTGTIESLVDTGEQTVVRFVKDDGLPSAKCIAYKGDLDLLQKAKADGAKIKVVGWYHSSFNMEAGFMAIQQCTFSRL